jgi:putative transposase
MDFVEDALATGRKLRTLTIVDAFSRECPRIEADSSLPCARIVRVLDNLLAIRGKPESLLVDNGPEFIGKALALWAYNNGVTLHFTRPGKPTDKPRVESFHGKFRDECLNENDFLNVHDARRIIEKWRHYYNHDRPQMALTGLTPKEFLDRWTALKVELDPVELGKGWERIQQPYPAGVLHQDLATNRGQVR